MQFTSFTNNNDNTLVTSTSSLIDVDSVSSMSPLSPLNASVLTAIHNPNPVLYKDLKMFLESSSSLLTSNYNSPNNPRLNAKKTRLMKRLRNRIETRRGNSFSESTKKAKFFQENNQCLSKEHSTQASSSIYSRINHLARSSVLSFEKVKKFDAQDPNLSEMFSINQSIKIAHNRNEESEVATTIVLNKNIKSAYF